MSVRSRIGHALAASAFGQAVTVLSQLLLTPLFFRFWGAGKYGEWLILSSIPAYLTMADLGIGSAAGNEMALRAGAGDRRGAQQTFLGALWVSALAAAGVLLLGGIAAGVVWWWQVPDTPSIPPAQAAQVLVLLALMVGLGLIGGVVFAGYRCCEHNALGIALGNVARLVEVVITGVLLVTGGSPLAVCIGMVMTRALMLLAQTLLLRRLCDWLFTPGVQADRGIVRRLMAPALGFLAFPLGNALALQGPLLIIGAVLGGPAVAMFSALRTLARAPMQLTAMINASVWPEMSRAYGAGNLPLLRRLHQTAWGSTVVLITAMGLGLVAGGEWIVHRWLGAEASYHALVFVMLIAITVLSAAWNASAVVLTAINAHLRLGLGFVVLNLLGIALASVLLAHLGWGGLVGPLLAVEAALLLWVLGRVLRVTGDAYGPFAARALSEPWKRAAALLR